MLEESPYCLQHLEKKMFLHFAPDRKQPLQVVHRPDMILAFQAVSSNQNTGRSPISPKKIVACDSLVPDEKLELSSP